MSKKDQKFYWILQITGWGIFFVIYTSFGLFWYEYDWRVIVNYLNIAVFGFIITHFYHQYIKKNHWRKFKLSKLVARIIIASIILGAISLTFILPVTFYLYGSSAQLSMAFTGQMIINLSIVYLIWNLIYFFLKLFKSYKESEIEQWRLSTVAKDAQLIALKSQINPHFIFNSLNNIRSLVIENPEKARDMITYLSGLLRYSIQFNSTEMVTVQDEMNIVNNYLNLESVQLEDRLRYNFQIDKSVLSKKIPPMSIQILVENAIKHGISQLPEGGEINISSKIIENELVVEVTNTGKLRSESTGDKRGIGIKNTTERLKHLFGEFSELTLKDIDNGLVSAKFTIPIYNT